MDTIQTYLARLVQVTHKNESEIIAEAIKSGLQQLWRDYILGQYLRGDLSRDEAIEQVGIDWVGLAERQHQAAQNDVTWGLDEACGLDIP